MTSAPPPEEQPITITTVASSQKQRSDGRVSSRGGGMAMEPDAGLCRAAGAEALGAALLVLGSCLPAAAPALHRALAAGAVVTMLVHCLDHISLAMFNPAVSLAGAASGRVSWRRAALYLPAQLAGAALGAAAHRLLAPHAPGAAPDACSVCVTSPAGGGGGGGVWRAACLEGAGGACLALANLAHWDPRTRATNTWPLRIGATVAALALALGEATGGSVNPARSFGPALAYSCWQHHWVYWVGPLGGALLAALLYRAAWPAPPAPTAPTAHAQDNII